MNKLIAASALLLSAGLLQAAPQPAAAAAAPAAVNSHALAHGQQAGGFTGPDAVRQVTIAEARKLKDDTAVKVRGHFVRSLGGDKYEFRDDTGSITVEVDHEDWRGQQVTPADLVLVTGEVDKGLRKVELDADRVEILRK